MLRVLIADDDSASNVLLKRLLLRWGFDIITAFDGAHAWKILQEENAPPIAILDWMMPEMDGLEVIRRVRAREADGLEDLGAAAAVRRAYLILLTTRTEKDDIIAGLKVGADDYLTKPFHQGELLARVEVGLRMIAMEGILAAKVEELATALDQIKTLKGILPICASCKKIRDDAGYWNQLEAYLSEHTEAAFSHSICPECRVKLYPGVGSSETGERS